MVFEKQSLNHRLSLNLMSLNRDCTGVLKSRVSEIRVKRIRFIQGVGVSKVSKKGLSFPILLQFFGKHNFGHVLFKLKMPCFNNPKNQGSEELKNFEVGKNKFALLYNFLANKFGKKNMYIKINKCSSGQSEIVNCRLF